MQWAATKYFNKRNFLERIVMTGIGKGKTRDPETGWETNVLVPARLPEGSGKGSGNVKMKQRSQMVPKKDLQHLGTSQIQYKIQAESKGNFYLPSMRNMEDDNGITIMDMLIIVIMIILVIILRRSREAGEFVLYICERMVLWREPCKNIQQLQL